MKLFGLFLIVAGMLVFIMRDYPEILSHYFAFTVLYSIWFGHSEYATHKSIMTTSGSIIMGLLGGVITFVAFCIPIVLAWAIAPQVEVIINTFK